ncbi:hypothetical protein C5S42_09910, partial [Candidatus Methanomarinus sp.]
MIDNKYSAFIRERLETGRMTEAIETSEAIGSPLPKEELEKYLYEYLEKGWMDKAVQGSKAAKIELSDDILTSYLDKYLDEEQ